MRWLGVHHYMYSLFLSSFLCRFTWYSFILGQILFVYLYMFEMIGGCHVCRPFTIPPKTVGFSRTGVIHSETLPKQQRDGMQLALLPGWKWSLEKSLVFMCHLKKECPIPHRRLCNGQHFSRNQLLHDKSVGDILGICSSSRLFKGSQKKNISLPEEIWGWPFRNLLVPESGFQRLIPYNSTVFRVNVHCHLSLSYAFNMGFNGGIIWNYGKVSVHDFCLEGTLSWNSRFEPVEELGDEYTCRIDPTGISPVIKTMAANRLTFAGWSEYHMVVQLFMKVPNKGSDSKWFANEICW